MPPHCTARTYTFHSRFRSVYNYVTIEGDLHCLSLPSVGAGPGITWVASLPEPPPNELVVSGDRQLIAPTGLAIVDSSHYDPRLPEMACPPFPRTELRRISNSLSPLLPGTACSTLPGCHPPATLSSIVRNTQNHIRDGLNTLKKGHYAEGARQLRGVGPGLTPAGDDVLCGFLWALSTGDRQWHSARATLYEQARGDNPISNHFLKAARYGLFFEHIKAWVDVVLAIMRSRAEGGTDNSGQNEEFERTSRRVLQHGSTSGADTLAGLLHGWEHMHQGHAGGDSPATRHQVI